MDSSQRGPDHPLGHHQRPGRSRGSAVQLPPRDDEVPFTHARK